MVNATIQTLRMHDRRVLLVRLSINLQQNDYAQILFKCSGKTIEILSTSNGIIQKDQTLKLEQHKSEVYLEYCSDDEKIECVTGYFRNHALIASDAIWIYFDNTLSISTDSVGISYLRTIPASYEVRLKDFEQSLSRYQSPWRLEISSGHDVLMKFVQKSNVPSFASFGEDSTTLCVSDYVFRLEPQADNLTIPREIIHKKAAMYKPSSSLAVFELIEPDFVESKTNLYKAIISNHIPLSGLLVE